ncbi:MAG: HEAT repeat domain-containing protein [Theionarchaea archaeon]|nr:HEAT repeat domain-containing protein [Theionarchaea archaeon]
MNNPRETLGSAFRSKEMEEYYEKLKRICESNDEKMKIQIAEKMARRINENTIFSLLQKLAEDTHACKMQALLTLDKVENPNENVLKILGFLLTDSNHYARIEASRVLTNLAEMGISNLNKLTEKLFKGGHKEKKFALRIYEQIWESFPEQAIQNLGKEIFQEGNYIIFKGIIDLLGEIGKKYPKETAKLMGNLLPTIETSDKRIVLNAITKFAKDHPTHALHLLFQMERSNDISSKFIPDVLPLTVDMLPERTFELLRNLAASDHNAVRFSVMKSLVHFEFTYPKETLELLFEMWKKTGDDGPGYMMDEWVTQREIKSRFIKVGIHQPFKALSFLQVLAAYDDKTKRKYVMEAAFELASEAPDKVFSLLEVFSRDPDYEIRKSAISFLRGEWNTFPEKTVALLELVMKEEVEKLQEEIEKIFSPANRRNPHEVIVLLKRLENGDSKILLDIVFKTAFRLHKSGEKTPQELLVDGISTVQKESIRFLSRNYFENWEKGLEFLEELSRDYEPSIKIIGLRILPRFLPTNLNTVLKILERSAKNEVAQVRVKALEFIIQLMKDYPAESFEIIKKIYKDQNKNVRIDIAKRLFRFKKNFPKESFRLLKEYSEDPNPEVRLQVALLVPKYIDSFPQKSLGIIAKLCVDENDLVLRTAFNFLEKFMEKDSRNVLSIVENLHANSNPAIREKIASFLGNFKKEHSGRVIEIIENLARDSIGSVRSSAFSSFDKISKYQPEKALNILTTTLAFEKNPEIKERVIRSIGVLSQSCPFDVEVLEQFLQDDDISVRIQLALTLGKTGIRNPQKATKIFRRLLLLERDELLKEAIAEAMADYGEYCPYEAMKILFYLSKNSNDVTSRKIENSFYILKKKRENFFYILQNCFRESFLTLEKRELLNHIEMIVKKTTYEEKNAYMKELVHRYNLYYNLLRFSTISRIHTSESLLTKYIDDFQLVDESIERALPALKDIVRLLGKQSFYAKRDDKIENLKDCLDLLEKTERQFTRELKEFDNPDRYILQSVLKAWQDIISIEFVKLRGKAELKTILESKKAMRREKNAVRLKLVNEGISKAENITISILPSRDFTIVGPPDRFLRILSPNEFAKIEFSIKMKNGNNSLRLSFTITFDDAERGGKTLNFADLITFIESKREYKEMKNPYIPGIPLRTPKMFYGRNKFLKDIEITLKIMDRTHILILHGQRRTGKTSILYQLKIRLEDNFLPVILDFQGIPDSGTGNFFYWVTREIWRELSKRNFEVAMPDESKFIQRPAFYFRDVFLQEATQKLGICKMILMMDEFEAIDDKIHEGKIDRDVLTFMRNLMQHSDKIDFIFSGTHQLEEMSSDYWSVLFNIGLYHKISFLEQNEAAQLICDPVKEYMEYDPLAVEKILEMTAGHPYFVQLICYYLVEHQMKKRRNYATIEDVNEVLDRVVVAGTPHFEYIWDGMDRLEQIVLLTLANVLSSQSVSTTSDIVKYLRQFFFEIKEQRVREVFERFLNDDIIEQKTADHYWFKVKLIKHWCEKNKELHKLLEGM